MIIATQFVTGAWVSSRLVARLGMDRTLWIAVVGVSVPSFGLLLVHDSTSIVALVVPFAVYAFFNGFIFPTLWREPRASIPVLPDPHRPSWGLLQLGTGALVAFVLSLLPTGDAFYLAVFLVGLAALSVCGMILVRTAQR